MDVVARGVQRRLLPLFLLARQQFFPRWDSSKKWEVIAVQHRDTTGYCSSKEKRIYIDPHGVVNMPDDGLLALLVHEICHDVTTAYHTERWAERMEKSARKAESLKQARLANMIRASVYAEVSTGKAGKAAILAGDDDRT